MCLRECHNNFFIFIKRKNPKTLSKFVFKLVFAVTEFLKNRNGNLLLLHFKFPAISTEVHLQYYPSGPD